MQKCVILGDSISEGIGSRKMNYVPKLEQLTNNKYSFINLAKTGTTIKYAFDHLSEILDTNPDVVILMYGSVDAQIRANINGNRFGICRLIPKRYKIGGMLEPRAFNSHKWYKRILNYCDNIIRFIIKRVVLLTQGKVQWVKVDQFAKWYEYVVQTLRSRNIYVITVSTIYLDDKYFLNSSFEYEQFNECIKKIAIEYKCTYMDLYSELKSLVHFNGWDMYYSHDHFHPNERGYSFFAERLYEFLNKKDHEEFYNDN